MVCATGSNRVGRQQILRLISELGQTASRTAEQGTDYRRIKLNVASVMTCGEDAVQPPYTLV
jgi:predicted ATPase